MTCTNGGACTTAATQTFLDFVARSIVHGHRVRGASHDRNHAPFAPQVQSKRMSRCDMLVGLRLSGVLPALGRSGDDLFYRRVGLCPNQMNGFSIRRWVTVANMVVTVEITTTEIAKRMKARQLPIWMGPSMESAAWITTNWSRVLASDCGMGRRHMLTSSIQSA